jgi:hypothetical protein
MTEYATIAKFHSVEEAHPIISVLVENNIPYVIKQERDQLDPIIIGNSMDPMLFVNIPVDEFAKANKLISDLNADTPPQEYSPERLDSKWIIVGYIFSLISFAGLLGGLSIITSSKRLSDGRKVKIYDDYTIKHGKAMLVIGIVSSIIWMMYKFEFPVNIGL